MSTTKNRLKALRNAKGLTQNDLAQKLNSLMDSNEKPISKMTVSNWENNKHSIKQDKAELLAKLFNVSVPYLLGYIDEDSPFTNPKLEEVLTRFSEEPNKLREYAKTHDISDRIEEITESDELFSFYDNLDKVMIQIDGKESLSNSEKKAIERLRIELSTYIDMLYDIKLKLQSIEANSTPNTK